MLIRSSINSFYFTEFFCLSVILSSTSCLSMEFANTGIPKLFFKIPITQPDLHSSVPLHIPYIPDGFQYLICLVFLPSGSKDQVEPLFCTNEILPNEFLFLSLPTLQDCPHQQHPLRVLTTLISPSNLSSTTTVLINLLFLCLAIHFQVFLSPPFLQRAAVSLIVLVAAYYHQESSEMALLRKQH